MIKSKSEILRGLADPGIVPVVRTQDPDQVPAICKALIDGGMRAVELTLTIPNAIPTLRAAVSSYGDQVLIGAGTVLDGESCRQALQAGADFIVSPITRSDIAEVAIAADRPVILGAYTPTEAQAAHLAGADIIKIFPADSLGPAYLKALRGPLPHLKLMPTGGVEMDNMKEFFNAGCVVLGVGSSLIRRSFLANSDWEGLSKLTRDYVAAARAAVSQLA